jgi:hypothetical protein
MGNILTTIYRITNSMINSDPSYQFISNPYPREGDLYTQDIPSIQTIISVFDRDVSRFDLIASFQDFLVASGYVFAEGETLGAILDE